MNSNIITRYLHRRYVKNQGELDRKNQKRLGLLSFPDEWNTHVLSKKKPEVQIPRIIWMLWFQGEQNAPPLVEASFKSWKEFNPNWEIRVLDEKSIDTYLDMPTFAKNVSPNHKANILRLLLLYKYGGIWADATTLCLKPLDDWIDYVTKSGFFAFSKPQPLRPVANWFIASNPKSYVTDEWLKWSKHYILNHKKPDTYFWQHFTFKWLVKKDPTFQEIWCNTPQIIARGPHILQRILDEDLNHSTDPDSNLMALLPLVKLNWKKGYTLQKIDSELTKRGINLKAIRE